MDIRVFPQGEIRERTEGAARGKDSRTGTTRSGAKERTRPERTGVGAEGGLVAGGVAASLDRVGVGERGRGRSPAVGSAKGVKDTVCRGLTWRDMTGMKSDDKKINFFWLRHGVRHPAKPGDETLRGRRRRCGRAYPPPHWCIPAHLEGPALKAMLEERSLMYCQPSGQRRCREAAAAHGRKTVAEGRGAPMTVVDDGLLEPELPEAGTLGEAAKPGRNGRKRTPKTGKD